MRKKRLFLVLTGAAVVMVVGLIVGGLFREREPEYGGKRLSEWVEFYKAPPPLNALRQSEEADDAVRHVGTNAIPYLIKWIRYEPPAWKVRAYENVASILHKPRNSWQAWDRQDRLAMASILALSALGHDATTAIPELSRIGDDPKRKLSSARGVIALGEMGSVALPALVSLLTNQNGNHRAFIAQKIASMGTNARAAVPVLVHCLKETNELVAASAAGALGRIGLGDPIAVPALMNSLQDARAIVRLWATNALRQIAPKVLEMGRGE